MIEMMTFLGSLGFFNNFSLPLQYPEYQFNFNLYISLNCNFRVLMIICITFSVTEFVDFFH